jgi:hypothetical protein
MLRSILIRLGLATTDDEGEASLDRYAKGMREIRKMLHGIEDDTERLGELTDSFDEGGEELREDEVASLMRSMRDGFDEVSKRAGALAEDMRHEERREVKSAMSSGSSDAAEGLREEWETLGSAWSSIDPSHSTFEECSYATVVSTMDKIEEQASKRTSERQMDIEVFEHRPREYIEAMKQGDAQALGELMDEVHGDG